VGTSKPGQYRVRTVMLGHDSYQNREGVAQNIEIVIDQSSSMDGEKINTVNKRMPIFLSQLRGSLSENQSLNVEVYAFSEDISHYNTYTLTHSDSSTISWKNIGTGGGTDLTKVGDRLKLSNPDERKVVVAFTDGEHTSSKSDLGASLSSISKMQHEGCFAQPYFCLWVCRVMTIHLISRRSLLLLPVPFMNMIMLPNFVKKYPQRFPIF